MTIAPVRESLLLESDYNVFSITLDGANKTYLTLDGNADSQNTVGSWSTDGSKVAYTNVKSSDPVASGGLLVAEGHIWTVDADGGGQRQLTFGPLYGALPSFSPDGTKILFTGFATGNPELWLMNADGSDAHPITQTTGSNVAIDGVTVKWSTHGTFSPDGKEIAYSSTQSGPPEIWVMNSDGSDPTQLTFPENAGAPDANNPTWSPDGSKIAFFGGYERDGGYIFTIKPDCSDRTQLTGVRSDDPSWSPDSQQIIYDAVSNGAAAAWIMAADGTHQRVLASLPHGPSRLAAIETVRTTDVPDTPYMADVYRLFDDVLARLPDTGELATDLNELANGTTEDAVRATLAHSPEAAQDLYRVFLNALERTPDAAELAGMQDQLAEAGTTQGSITPGGGVTTVAPAEKGALLTAQAGVPTSFEFSSIGFGNATIAGFDPTRDAISFSSSTVSSFGALQSDLSSVADGTLITLDSSDSLRLDGVAPADLTSANFRFL